PLNLDVSTVGEVMYLRSLFDLGGVTVNSDNSRVTFDIKVRDCTGAIFANSKRSIVSIDNTELLYIRTARGVVSENVAKISNSKIWPLVKENNTRYYFQDDMTKLLIENSEIKHVKYNNVDATRYEAMNNTRSISNYISANSTLDQDSVNALWKSFELGNDMYKKASI
uniref:hypothetical protein n=1 Tax=Photobacterium sanguinicancri TaxID=875932 RepID=UPI0024819531